MSLSWSTRSGRSSRWIRRSTRLAIYARDNFDCVYCRGVFPPATGHGDLTLDHVIPRTQGGTNDPTNLVTCCYSCNSSRQDRELTKTEMRRARKAMSKRLNSVLGRKLYADEIQSLCLVYSTGSSAQHKNVAAGSLLHPLRRVS